MHVHGTVQHYGHGQLSARLLPLACPGVQRAEAEVTVRLERTHAERFGQGEGLTVVVFGLVCLRGIAMQCNIAEKAQCPRLGAPFLVGTGELQSSPGMDRRFL